MSSKNESFPFCARAQIKCSAYSSFGRNVARKSFKNLTRDTAVAIPRAECRRCRLSFSRGRRRSEGKQREPGFLIYINYTRRSFYLGRENRRRRVARGPLLVLQRRQLFSQSANMINCEGIKDETSPDAG